MKSWMPLIGLAALLGCASAEKRSLTVPEPSEYRVGAEDVLEISIAQAEALSRTVPVRPDGQISVPLLGDVQAADKSARALSAELQQRYASYLQDPRVTVIVREVNSPRIFVVGEVARPGAFPLRGRLDVVQALALAGGFATFADRSGVVLLRSRGREADRLELDYDELIDGTNRAPILLPGDTIYVP